MPLASNALVLTLLILATAVLQSTLFTYMHETKISKGLLEPPNCIPYSFVYSRYT